MGVCTGIYTDMCVFDRADFARCMAEGMPIAAYMEKEKNAGIRIATNMNQAGKNRFVVYYYDLNGIRYYGATKIAYSWDIRGVMANQACAVSYDDNAPYNSVIDVNARVTTAAGNTTSNNGVISLILGIVSLCFCSTIVVGLITGIIGIILGKKSNAENANNGDKIGLYGMVISGIGLGLSILMLLVIVGIIVFAIIYSY